MTEYWWCPQHERLLQPGDDSVTREQFFRWLSQMPSHSEIADQFKLQVGAGVTLHRLTTGCRAKLEKVTVEP